MANLFDIAKDSSPVKKEKGEVIEINKLSKIVGEINEIDVQLAELQARREILDSEIREAGRNEMLKLYNQKKRFPGTLKIKTNGGSFQFITSDKYIKIDKERYEELNQKFGDVATESTVFYFNNEILEKYKAVISKLIMESKKIEAEDKANLLKSETSYSIKKGTISSLFEISSTHKVPINTLIEEVKPIFSVKMVKE